MDREENIKERNFTTNADYLQSITDGKGAGQWEAAWAGQTSAGIPSWWPGINVMFTINLRHWLHAAFPLRCPDSDSPGFIDTRKAARRFSWSKCQGNGTEDDHTRYRQTTTAALLRSQLIPYGLKSRQPRATAPEPRPKAHRKNGETSPGCARDKHEGNSLADIVAQLWTLKPHLHLAQKATTFPSPRLNNWSSNTKHLCKEFLQSAVGAMWSPFSSISQTTLTTNISCHTFY